MNDFLRAQYDQARDTYLENLAYMDRQNQEFAEQNGGADNLPDDKRRIYEGRRMRIIRLVAYHDRAQEYIEDLHAWISQLIQENRSLTAGIKEAEQGWIKYFPNISNPNQSESDREYRRKMSVTKLQIEMPELF